jgi:hypothetical protein
VQGFIESLMYNDPQSPFVGLCSIGNALLNAVLVRSARLTAKDRFLNCLTPDNSCTG